MKEIMKSTVKRIIRVKMMGVLLVKYFTLLQKLEMKWKLLSKMKMNQFLTITYEMNQSMTIWGKKFLPSLFITERDITYKCRKLAELSVKHSGLTIPTNNAKERYKSRTLYFSHLLSALHGRDQSSPVDNLECRSNIICMREDSFTFILFCRYTFFLFG